MANPEVTVIDYGMGNIFSVIRAFEASGANVNLTSSAEKIHSAQILVLPGVGAFEDGMKELRTRELIDSIKLYSQTGKPLLGICLGMQMLMDQSEEFGEHEGLGLIPGKVMTISDTTEEGLSHKIPHIGWNELKTPANRSWSRTILDGIVENSSVYFVHSYTCVPSNPSDRLADTYYNGRKISAVIRNGNVYGCQFHPEKSANTGLQILRNFMTLDR